MAKETKNLELANSQVASVVKMYEMFAWEVLSQQRVYHKSQEVTGGGTNSSGVHTTNYLTTTVDFMQVTLQRDKAMPNYMEIANLEDEYFKCLDTYNLLNVKLEIKSFNFIAFVLLGMVTIGIGSVIYLIHHLIVKSKNKKAFFDTKEKRDKDLLRISNRMKEIENQVAKLF